MEMKSPTSVTVRRNPPRRARPTPYSAAPLSQPPSSKTSSAIRSFPIEDILSINVSDKAEVLEPSCSGERSDSEKLKVFLRIRPIVTQHKVGGSVKSGFQRNVWPQNPRKKGDSKPAKAAVKKTVETCLKVNDEHSVTLSPPQNLTDARRTKLEVYEGFSHVFCDDTSQSEVYVKMMNPLVVDFLKGKSGMLAAMGPSGSGKTHTVFGSTRQPGMVSLALRQIFSQKESGSSKCSRTFYLSMFEIYSERGKGEKIMDLSQEGGDLYMQQSNIKGLKEVVIHDVQQAESLIASGMLKRSTAMTNSNIQSSRSQCIINIRCDLDNLHEDQPCTSILTIVDLAGAEREKRTGNQGSRLLESNFINNTSMVFGLCLRSLLEHQKNPKKPLHKHFQNSLLTKYLRDFLEGKKRMALILTAKPGEEDYQDTSYLLRQASPFMNIKFESIEEQPVGNKRRTQTLPKAEQAKRMKLHTNEVCMDDEVKSSILREPHKEELIPEPGTEVKTNGSLIQFPVTVNDKTNKNKFTKESIADSANKPRENQILLNFSRTLWKVLKEYKNKLEISENEADALRHNLTAEKERCAALEIELNLMKASCSCGKVPIAEEKDEIDSNARVSSSHSIKMEYIKKKQITTDTEYVEEQSNEEKNDLCEYVVFDKEDLIELGDTEFSNNIAVAVYDTLESGVSDSELLLHEDEGPFLNKGGQRKHEEEELAAQDSSLDELECFQKQDILYDTVTIDHEITPVQVALKDGHLEQFEEKNKEKVEFSSPKVVLDKQEFQETEERGTNGEITELHMHGTKNSSFVNGDQGQQEEDSITQSSSSAPVVCQCFEKQDILDDTGVSFVDLEKLEEIIGVSNPNLVCDKHCFKEVEETSANGELTDEVYSSVSVEEVELEQEEKEVSARVSSDLKGLKTISNTQFIDSNGVSFVEAISLSGDFEKFEDHNKKKNDVSSSNLVCDKQEIKEVEETDADGEVTDKVSSSVEEIQPEQDNKAVKASISSSDMEVLKSDSNTQFIASTEAPDQQFVRTVNFDDSKLPEVPSVQPYQPLTTVKPKRRLRPASSMMLKNINLLEFDDATAMPKNRHGKRDENEDCRKRTQGSISLLRILKQNLHH